MTKRTRVLSGEAARRYFRGLFASEPGIGSEAANRLVETCVRQIAELRVRVVHLGPPVASIAATAARPEHSPGSQTVSAQDTAGPPTVEAGRKDAIAEPPFDPHAFSLIVTLRREGQDAFLSRLAAVADPARLVAIARAQHVGVPAEVAGSTDVDALVRAILEGTRRRIAHKEAAAS